MEKVLVDVLYISNRVLLFFFIFLTASFFKIENLTVSWYFKILWHILKHFHFRKYKRLHDSLSWFFIAKSSSFTVSKFLTFNIAWIFLIQ